MFSVHERSDFVLRGRFVPRTWFDRVPAGTVLAGTRLFRTRSDYKKWCVPRTCSRWKLYREQVWMPGMTLENIQWLNRETSNYAHVCEESVVAWITWLHWHGFTDMIIGSAKNADGVYFLRISQRSPQDCCLFFSTPREHFLAGGTCNYDTSEEGIKGRVRLLNIGKCSSVEFHLAKWMGSMKYPHHKLKNKSRPTLWKCGESENCSLVCGGGGGGHSPHDWLRSSVHKKCQKGIAWCVLFVLHETCTITY